MSEDKQAALYQALAKAQAEFKPLAKNRTVQIPTKRGGTISFSYADLEAVITSTRAALAKHGLAVVQAPDMTEAGQILRTSLVHEKGGRIDSSVLLPAGGYDMKEFGGQMTYLRRYSYTALLCIAADDDLDAAGRLGEQDEPEADISEDMGKIAAAENMEDLKKAGADAAAKYPRHREQFIAAYQKRKLELEQSEVKDDSIPGIE